MTPDDRKLAKMGGSALVVITICLLSIGALIGSAIPLFTEYAWWIIAGTVVLMIVLIFQATPLAKSAPRPRLP